MAQQRQLAWPTYIVVFTLVFLPVFDAAMQVIPFRTQDARWRFGAFGLFANGLVIPTIGFMIAFFASGMFEHRRFQRVLSYLAFAVALVVLVLLGLFALDTLQVRGDVKATAKLAFEIASVTAAFKGLLSIAALTGFGLAGLRAAAKPARAAVKEPARGGIVIGSNPPVAARSNMMPKAEPVVPAIPDKTV